MRAAFKYYGQIHREYLWLHAIFTTVLAVTSVFWFILPFFIFNYGYYTPIFPLQLFFVLVLFVFPSLFVTLHCWFISFRAAKKWLEQHPHESLWKWFLCFQSMAFFVVIIFTSIIYTLLLIIDYIR
ncbi:hypothetical protein [Solibacillus sp. FSL H8-0538]|uniref:hypothetical protein n=1 Tax=Solibacillus sp. FSL H8-0538 TaxID=2921400 RepID=UPI0030F5BE8F